MAKHGGGGAWDKGRGGTADVRGNNKERSILTVCTMLTWHIVLRQHNRSHLFQNNTPQPLHTWFTASSDWEWPLASAIGSSRRGLCVLCLGDLRHSSSKRQQRVKAGYSQGVGRCMDAGLGVLHQVKRQGRKVCHSLPKRVGEAAEGKQKVRGKQKGERQAEGKGDQGIGICCGSEAMRCCQPPRVRCCPLAA